MPASALSDDEGVDGGDKRRRTSVSSTSTAAHRWQGEKAKRTEKGGGREVAGREGEEDGPDSQTGRQPSFRSRSSTRSRSRLSCTARSPRPRSGLSCAVRKKHRLSAVLLPLFLTKTVPFLAGLQAGRSTLTPPPAASRSLALQPGTCRRLRGCGRSRPTTCR